MESSSAPKFRRWAEKGLLGLEFFSFFIFIHFRNFLYNTLQIPHEHHNNGIRPLPKSWQVSPLTFISVIINGMWKNRLNRLLLAYVILVQVSIVKAKGWSNYLDNSGRTDQALGTPLSFCSFCLSNLGIASILFLLTELWSYYIFNHRTLSLK